MVPAGRPNPTMASSRSPKRLSPMRTSRPSTTTPTRSTTGSTIPRPDPTRHLPHRPPDVSDAGADKTPQRRRPPPGRISPQALADARGGALEGLDWLGRTPESNASLFYRAMRLLARAILVGAFRFRIQT